MNKKPITDEKEHALYVLAEADANRFNLICLAILCGFVILSQILVKVGVFYLSANVSLPSFAFGFIFFLTPILFFIFNDWLLNRETILKKPFLKYLIITFSFLGTGVLCVTLSMHAILFVAIPPLVAAQYQHRKKIFYWVIFASVMLVPVGVYGSYFYGVIDRNLLKDALSEGNLQYFSTRLKYATPQRMLELFYHYAIPRILGTVAIGTLAFGIARRNAKMLLRQAELSETVREEMERRNAIQNNVIEALSAVIETRDVGTGEHVVRTKKYVKMIADALLEDEKFRDRLAGITVEEIVNAAPLHDVGKIAISDTILLKPGKLTAEEFEKMKTHTLIGGEMVQSIFTKIEDPGFLEKAKEIAVSHHERWDGAGYPYGMKGEEIPLSARIMAIADVFDALVSERCYKSPISPEEAMGIILSESGNHFDPEIIRVVSGMQEELIRAAKTPVSI